RLLTANRLEVEESALTGESVPRQKRQKIGHGPSLDGSVGRSEKPRLHGHDGIFCGQMQSGRQESDRTWGNITIRYYSA
ncbi:hypothetical protein, partial [Brevibacillus agri]|uniref:hypothetical protein n=1 Tax=Brevibacillus agri TaxID=51101 RepID=UPI001C3F56E8